MLPFEFSTLHPSFAAQSNRYMRDLRSRAIWLDGSSIMRMRRSVFPVDKPFERQPPTTQLSEIAFRLVVDFYSNEPVVVGTATTLCGHLLVTAKHVVEDVLPPIREGSVADIQCGLTALQILPGPEYALWEVMQAWVCTHTDLALLHLAAAPTVSNPNASIGWRQPIVSPLPPSVGERIAGFGYRKSKIAVSKNSGGGNHYDLQDDPIASVGIVREIFAERRDSHNLPFPCYQVSARFDSGMSGGPVFDETGALCGLICCNIEGSELEGEPLSYVTTLWPVFLQVISAGRGARFPSDARYPVAELVRNGLIKVTNPEVFAAWPSL